MADKKMRTRGAGNVEIALALGLSAAFIVLAVVVSPVMAALAVLPASVAIGRWRAHSRPVPLPHSLSVPVYATAAVIHAPRVSESVRCGPDRISPKSATAAA